MATAATAARAATQPDSETTLPAPLLTRSSYAGKRIAALLAALTAEMQAQTEHVALLEAQTEALKACDRAGYALLHDRHERMLTEAEERSFDMRRLVGHAGSQSSLKSEIAGWPEPERGRAMELSGSLQAVALRVGDLSERNGVLIRGELRLIAFQMNFIMTAAHQDASYASTGASQTVQASRLLNSVA